MEDKKDKGQDPLASFDPQTELLKVTQADLEAAQAELKTTRAELEQAKNELSELRNQPTIGGDEDMKALARTIRQCQRNGHPDVAKHIEALVVMLGA